MRLNTRKQEHTSVLTKNVFFVCKKRDRQQKKKEAKKRTDKKELVQKMSE